MQHVLIRPPVCCILTTSSALLSSSPVLGMYVSVVSGHLRDGLQLRFGLGLQQRLLVLRLLLHPAVGLPLTQTLGVGGVELLDSVAAAVQPAGGRLLHHQGQPGRGERQHVQEHPGEFISQIFLSLDLQKIIIFRTKEHKIITVSALSAATIC